MIISLWSTWSSYRPIRIKFSIYGAFDHIYQDMTTVNDFSGIGAGNRMLVFMCALDASKSMRVRSFMMDNLVVICLIMLPQRTRNWLISFHVNALVISAILHAQFSSTSFHFYSSGHHSRHDNILFTADFKGSSMQFISFMVNFFERFLNDSFVNLKKCGISYWKMSLTKIFHTS